MKQREYFRPLISTSGSGYLQLSKRFIEKLGYQDAYFLTILMDTHDYWLKVNRLRADGSFYFTFADMKAEYCITEHSQQQSIKRLVTLGLLTYGPVKRSNKHHYTLHAENIKRLLLGDKYKSPAQETTDEERDMVYQEVKTILEKRPVQACKEKEKSSGDAKFSDDSVCLRPPESQGSHPPKTGGPYI